MFSPSGIMLSRVRPAAPAAAQVGSGSGERTGSGTRDDAHPEIQAAPAQQRQLGEAESSGADAHLWRRSRRRRRAEAGDGEAPPVVPSGSDDGEVADTDFAWEAQVLAE